MLHSVPIQVVEQGCKSKSSRAWCGMTCLTCLLRTVLMLNYVWKKDLDSMIGLRSKARWLFSFAALCNQFWQHSPKSHTKACIPSDSKTAKLSRMLYGCLTFWTWEFHSNTVVFFGFLHAWGRAESQRHSRWPLPCTSCDVYWQRNTCTCQIQNCKWI
jgi:hypothetical protein